MNIIKKAIRTTLPVLAAVFALAGCVKEHPVDGTGGVPKTGTTFTILLPEAEVVETRAANHTVDENRIDKLHVLSFNSSDVLIGDHALDEAALVPTSEAENKNILKVTVVLPLGTESLMFVANLPAVNESALNTDGSVDKDDIAAMVVTASAKWTLTSSTGAIPMFGELPGITPPSQPISLVRMLARINVSAAGISTSTFKLTSIRYYNYNDRGFIIQQTESSADADGVKAPVVPGGAKQTGQSLDYIEQNGFSGNACANTIYVFEAKGKNGFALTGTDYTNWKNNPCLVVGGSYNGGAESFYRIDFIEKGTPDKWHHIMRNFTYNVSINSVTGDGYGDFTTALESAPMNMDVSTFPIDGTGAAAIATDGPYFLSVTKESLTLGGAAGNETLMQLYRLAIRSLFRPGLHSADHNRWMAHVKPRQRNIRNTDHRHSRNLNRVGKHRHRAHRVCKIHIRTHECNRGS